MTKYIVPTLNETERSAFDARVAAIKPHFTRAQLDVLNDTMISGQTIADPTYVENNIGKLMLEIDLMVSLDNYDLDQWNRPWVDKICFHIEACSDPVPILDKINAWGKRAFLSLNPDTPLEAIEEYCSVLPDGIFFMTVQPGKNGSQFIPSVIEKIKVFRQKYPDTEIEVDGGVTDKTMPSLLEAGVDGFAVGSYLANASMEERLFSLLSILENEKKH